MTLKKRVIVIGVRGGGYIGSDRLPIVKLRLRRLILSGCMRLPIGAVYCRRVVPFVVIMRGAVERFIIARAGGIRKGLYFAL